MISVLCRENNKCLLFNNTIQANEPNGICESVDTKKTILFTSKFTIQCCQCGIRQCRLLLPKQLSVRIRVFVSDTTVKTIGSHVSDKEWLPRKWMKGLCISVANGVAGWKTYLAHICYCTLSSRIKQLMQSSIKWMWLWWFAFTWFNGLLDQHHWYVIATKIPTYELYTQDTFFLVLFWNNDQSFCSNQNYTKTKWIFQPPVT